MQLPLIEVEYEGVVVKVDVNDFDALEWRALRMATGLTASAVFNDLQQLDPFAVAGLVWMVQRRDTPSLAFDDVARNIRVGHVLDQPDGDAEVVLGPRRRQQLLEYLPALSAVCNVRPWEVDQLTSAEVAEFIGFLAGIGPKEVADGP